MGPAIIAPVTIDPKKMLKAKGLAFSNVSFLTARIRAGKMMDTPSGAIVVQQR
jgi:hypothetical protein